MGTENPSAAAGIYYTAKGKVLLLRRAKGAVQGGTWAFPGGKVEDGESARDAAAREFGEETGTAMSDPAAMRFQGSSNGFTTFRYDGDSFTPTLNDEHTAFMWCAPDDLPTPLHPGIEEIINGGQAMDSARVEDVNGYVEIRDNPISRAGVFEYPGWMIGKDLPPQQKYKVWRPEAELSSPDCIQSFRLTPWIDGHVMLGPQELGFVPPEQKGVHGVIGEDVYFKDGVLYGNLKLFSDKLGEVINSGEKRELSAGFRCKYEFTSGVYNGESYDVVQRNIRGNHLASVTEGRMGPDVAVLDELRFTFDAKDFKMADETKKDDKAKEGTAKDSAETSEAEHNGGEGEMTLEQAHNHMKQILPVVAKIQAMIEKMGAGKSDAAVKEGSAQDGDTKEKDGDTKAATDAKDGKAMDAKDGIAMDAKIVALESQVADLKRNGVKTIMGEVRQRDALASKLSGFIGVFDASDKTLDEVAVYGAEKLGLKPTKGSELAAVEGYLHGRTAPKAASVGIAMDGAISNEIDDFLAGKDLKKA